MNAEKLLIKEATFSDFIMFDKTVTIYIYIYIKSQKKFNKFYVKLTYKQTYFCSKVKTTLLSSCSFKAAAQYIVVTFNINSVISTFIIQFS